MRLVELYGLQKEVEVSDPQVVKYDKIPAPARIAHSELYRNWYKKRIAAADEMEDELTANAIRQHSSEWMEKIDGPEWRSAMDDDSRIWITDGHDVVSLHFDDRFGSLETLERNLDRAIIMYWDGHSWSGNDERIFDKSLSSAQMAVVKSFCRDKEFGQHRHADVVKAFSKKDGGEKN